MLSPELSTAMILVALAVSIVSFIGCYAAVMHASRLSRERRDFHAIILELAELDDRLCALNDSHKRLRSRVGMRELRARKKNAQNGEDPDTPDDDEAAKWKREMRLKLHRGELKP